VIYSRAYVKIKEVLLGVISHEAFNASGEQDGDDFHELVQPVGAWDDVVWHLSDAAEVK
jgi:hypothetical protein